MKYSWVIQRRLECFLRSFLGFTPLKYTWVIQKTEKIGIFSQIFLEPLTLYVHVIMDSSFWFDTINLVCSIVYIEGSQITISCKIVFFSLKIVFALTNSVNHDEMLHHMAFIRVITACKTMHLGVTS